MLCSLCSLSPEDCLTSSSNASGSVFQPKVSALIIISSLVTTESTVIFVGAAVGVFLCHDSLCLSFSESWQSNSHKWRRSSR